MMRLFLLLLALAGASAAAPLAGQVALPPLGGVVQDTLNTVGRTVEPVLKDTTRIARNAQERVRQRVDRLARLVRTSGGAIEFDRAGAPARAGELLLISPNPEALNAVRRAGFAVLSEERLDALDIEVTRLRVPAGQPLAKAQAALEALLPEAEITADTLSFQSGVVSNDGSPKKPVTPAAPVATSVGMIDGAPRAGMTGGTTRSFAKGAPRASDHGSAIASLLSGAGVKRVLAADVYGSDPAGGSALAIGRAIDWLAGERARIVSISLVGPDNPLLARAIAAGRRRGIVFVAAVGNDGPAAPSAYPASYPGVVAVTGVDGRNRALIEAGRALHLDYAAPGADMTAINAAGKRVKVRGTSYATPLVAARAAAAIDAGADVILSLDAEARDLGPRGPDAVYGRGLVCAACRR